ncbi:MAG: SufE family protein [Gemmataceae bacterium]|nr:SufE family protein [Gemmataceae bacterium]
MEDWNDKYRQIIEFGEKLLPLPDEYRTEPNRVHGCQSTVYFHMRKKPGSRNTLEFLADSDADIVRGLIALLQNVYSGQPADQAAAFDVDGFFRRLGLDQNLSMGRRNGLGAMVKRIRSFAADMVKQS